MKISKNDLPSNKKFGYFFSIVFLITAAYFLYSASQTVGYLLAIIGLIFLLITIIRANLLLPLNRLWMQLGILLGIIVSPIILGIIFFGLFTPYALIMRVMKRDELNLKLTKKYNYWKLRSHSYPQTNFKRQF